MSGEITQMCINDPHHVSFRSAFSLLSISCALKISVFLKTRKVNETKSSFVIFELSQRHSYVEIKLSFISSPLLAFPLGS